MSRRALSFACLIVAAGLACACTSKSRFEGSPHKVYVMLGMHSNFYHSWRGDTPDEAGFGTDIRMVRALLSMLDEANAEGLDARAYWDTDNLFTLETILPRYAPDIIEGIRRRVSEGHDEVILAPYDNGLFGAMTEDEARAAVAWSISNPWGSGVRQLFGSFTPLIRPNEAMVTTGLARILHQEGVEGIVLAYSGYPFDGFGAFVPPLPPEQRYGATWLRLGDAGPLLVLLPCVSIGDVLNHISLERWMLDLRKLQVDGVVDGDLLIHINFDSDVESWLPQKLPPGLGWFPNAGGLPEYVHAVNKYDWAEFTTPARYLAGHQPVGEVTLRRDLADGAFDGHYSWAEKLPSHALWTGLERSRLATLRAEAWAADAPPEVAADVRRRLREGRDSSFFQRLRALSTTHFGMSTPLVNEERQAVGEAVVAAARERAEDAERSAAEARSAAPPARAVYAFRVRDLRAPGPGLTARALLRLPLLLPAPVPPLALVDAEGRPLAFSLLDPEPLASGGSAAELAFVLPLRPGETRDLALVPAAAWPAAAAGEAGRLANGALELRLDAEHGIASLRLGDWDVAGPGFLAPFVTYRSGERPSVWPLAGFELAVPSGEHAGGLARARLSGGIPFETPDGPARVDLRVDLSLPADVPWLVADVDVAYPYTQKRDILHTVQQKLRRPLDLRWIEVAPFPLRPNLAGSRERPLRVWKHNWLGVTSSFDLDYARVNPRNAQIDAFNHQVTAGWVAVSDRERGLLVGQSAEVRSSYAFAPMRLREVDGRQQLQLDPFGSFYGRQLDYSHLGGNGIGTEFTLLASASLHPNGPSYDGERERFSLLLAPYRGDAPPAQLAADAEAFFHPPAVLYTRAPAGVRLAADVRRRVEAERRAAARADPSPLGAARALLVNPSAGALDVVWDEPDDARVEGWEIEWRPVGGGAGGSASIGRARRHRIEGLEDGRPYAVRVRARGAGRSSAWSDEIQATPAAVPPVPTTSAARGASAMLVARTFWYGLVHLFTTP